MVWDDETIEGWRGARLDSFPAKGRVIEDGKLIVLDPEGEESLRVAIL